MSHSITIPQIICNKDGLYKGDLKRYFRIIFSNAKNLDNPYHNYRHLMHVMWQCYQACIFNRSNMTPEEMRTLLIAAMFHDFNHSGRHEDDANQIVRAITGFHAVCLDEDIKQEGEIVCLIRATQYPHVEESGSLSLSAQILRDADLTQALSTAWVQEVVFGLASERSQDPVVLLGKQVGFLLGIKFSTDWARESFTHLVESKVLEVQELLKILDG